MEESEIYVAPIPDGYEEEEPEIEQTTGKLCVVCRKPMIYRKDHWKCYSCGGFTRTKDVI